MNNLIIYSGSIYIIIGVLFLTVPLIYLELGRPKDLIVAFLNLLIGCILLIKNNTLDHSFLVIYFLLTVLVVFYVVELFLYRWNQLTDKEKSKLRTFLEFKNNLLKLIEAIKLGFRNLSKPLVFFNFDSNNQKISSKKWVRNDKNDNIKA